MTLTILFFILSFQEPIIIPRIPVQKEDTTLMSDMKPVYMCMNAGRSDHDCTWAICYSCKMKHDAEKERRIQGDFKKKRRLLRNSEDDSERSLRNALNRKYDNNVCDKGQEFKHICKHDDKHLIDYHGKAYFTQSYQDKIESDEIPFPTHCVICKLRISSKD